MDSKSVKVAVVGGESEKATAMEILKSMDDVEAVSKEEDAESDYRSAKDAKSQRQLNDLYTGKHRASTMYGITKGHRATPASRQAVTRTFSALSTDE